MMDTEDTSWMNQPRFSGEETKVCGNVRDDGIVREICSKPVGHDGNHVNFSGTVEWYQSSMDKVPPAPSLPISG